MNDLQALYQHVVLDHHRHPRRFRVVEGGRAVDAHNPLCGDHLTIYLRLEADTIVGLGFQGSACAIATAAASLLMERLEGLSRTDARALLNRFGQMVAAPPGRPIDDLGALSALAGVRQFPTRVKCARLAADALLSVLGA
jgi:nitrogen fixation NifU-like protein